MSGYDPDWREEHGASFAVPAEISGALMDISYRNDVCPAFCLRDDGGIAQGLGTALVRLWIDEPEPDQRECRRAKRWTVQDFDGNTRWESETAIPAEAIAALRRVYAEMQANVTRDESEAMRLDREPVHADGCACLRCTGGRHDDGALYLREIDG